MTTVLNDPAWWPEIEWDQSYGYFIGSWRGKSDDVGDVTYSIFDMVS